MSFIHPSAIVDEGASLGEGTKVWHFAHIMSGAVTGKHCSFGQNTFVANGVRIGDNVKVQNNVSLYEGIQLEDGVFCGPSMVFTNVRNPRSDFPVDNTSYSKTLVKRGATIGANATVVCGLTIGAWAMIGAGSVVTKDVPDYGLWVGVPAKQLGWVCQCCNQIAFAASAETRCSKCHRTYKLKGGMASQIEDNQ